jgi:glutamate 5-kinase
MSKSGSSNKNIIYKRIVVKIGTSVLSGNSSDNALDTCTMSDLVAQIADVIQIHKSQVLIVTSGAIAAGKAVIGHKIDDLSHRDILSRQVFAALGQGPLLHEYQQLFAGHNIQIAQTLLTTNDLSNRQSYLNVRNTLLGLLDMGVVPIINENDVVAVDEIGEVFGDNDRLSALVANLVDADLLIILTDTYGLYTADPKQNKDATLISEVHQVDDAIIATAGAHSNPAARGGMPTKLEAAQLVTTAGIPMVMCHGHSEQAILKVIRSESVGTKFHPAAEKLEARKRWLLSMTHDSESGEIIIDQGAAIALNKHGVSLLAAGIIATNGSFNRGDTIFVLDNNGNKIACGISNYTSADLTLIKGTKSNNIQDILGYYYGQEVIHRNNLVLI